MSHTIGGSSGAEGPVQRPHPVRPATPRMASCRNVSPKAILSGASTSAGTVARGGPSGEVFMWLSEGLCWRHRRQE